MSGTFRLAVIVPMYNEASNARRCVQAISEVILAHAPEASLVVVNDGSTDRTAEILDDIHAEGACFLRVDHEFNRGYGAALMSGVEAALEAKMDFGLFMDSDLTNDPALIPAFVRKAKEGQWDLIKASRYIPGGGMRGVDLHRQLISRLGNVIAERLFRVGIRDCTNGFRAVRLELLRGHAFAEQGFAMIHEELGFLKGKRARMTEIPYTLTRRISDVGESKFRYSPKMFWAYLKPALLAVRLRGNSWKNRS